MTAYNSPGSIKDDFRSGCQNVSRCQQQQLFLELQCTPVIQTKKETNQKLFFKEQQIKFRSQLHKQFS